MPSSPGGGDHREVFGHFRPGFDLERERRARLDAGVGETYEEADLYPDARPCLLALRAAGYLVGVAGNQPARAAELIRALDLPADAVATSYEWGVTKPAPAFFGRLAEVSGHPPEQIAYVGDRSDNDLRPARAAGLQPIRIVRGPWAHIDPAPPDGPTVTGLADLPELLAELR